MKGQERPFYAAFRNGCPFQGTRSLQRDFGVVEESPDETPLGQFKSPFIEK